LPQMSQTCAISIDSRYLTQKGRRASGRVVKGKFYRKIGALANEPSADGGHLGCFGQPEPQRARRNTKEAQKR
jgi:hypothetical protein